jgi:cytochrome o ubiquinol oxidase subunit II
MLRKIWLLYSTLLLSGCRGTVVLDPRGYVGLNEKYLIVIAAALMLIVVLPVIIMTLLFSWRYRESNKKAKYLPEWNSAKILEWAIWIVPGIIIVILSGLVWTSSHKLDPFRPLKASSPPLVIQVISMDWKWLFIYPEQNIAVVNKIVFPVNVPIHFYLTSATVMNSFFIPQLGSQIMTMPGMQTQLHLIANAPGVYAGISSNFSGFGFTGMTFSAIATSSTEFGNWIDSVRHAEKKLDPHNYRELAKPSVNNSVEYFSSVQPDLFKNALTSTEQ